MHQRTGMQHVSEAQDDLVGASGRADSRMGIADLNARRFLVWAAVLSVAQLLILTLTGLFLAQFYNPNPLAAYDSVLYTNTRVPLGDWIRSIHYLAAGGLVLTVVAVFVLMIVLRAYRRPYTFVWWLSVGGGGLLVLLIVTGTVLPADQEGYEAMAHLVAGGRFTGTLGVFFTEDFTSSTPLLSRVFSLHTSLLPLALAAVLALCLGRIRRSGFDVGHVISRLVRPTGFTAASLLAFAALGAIAAAQSIGLGQRAVAGVEITKPFWPLLWVYGLENTMGLWGMVLGPAVLFGALAALPLLDREATGTPVKPLVLWIVAILGSLVLALWLYGAFGPSRQHLGM